jgi:hypothetical protein
MPGIRRTYEIYEEYLIVVNLREVGSIAFLLRPVALAKQTKVRWLPQSELNCSVGRSWRI